MSVIVNTGNGIETYEAGVNIEVVDGGFLAIVDGGDDPTELAIHAPGHWRWARIVPVPAAKG